MRGLQSFDEVFFCAFGVVHDVDQDNARSSVRIKIYRRWCYRTKSVYAHVTLNKKFSFLMGCMEMSHSALAIYYKAVQATPQIPLRTFTLAQSGFSSQENIENNLRVEGC